MLKLFCLLSNDTILTSFDLFSDNRLSSGRKGEPKPRRGEKSERATAGKEHLLPLSASISAGLGRLQQPLSSLPSDSTGTTSSVPCSKIFSSECFANEERRLIFLLGFHLY